MIEIVPLEFQLKGVYPQYLIPSTMTNTPSYKIDLDAHIYILYLAGDNKRRYVGDFRQLVSY